MSAAGGMPLTATLPFTLEFVPLSTMGDLPALQSYAWCVTPQGPWLILGGRTQGLHHFHPGGGDNFPGPNQSLWMVDPAAGVVEELFDLRLLDPEIGDPLMATNQQSYFDQESGEWLILGGYGQDSKLGQPRTFDTLLRIPLVEFAGVALSNLPPLEKAAAMNIMIGRQHDPFFAVTGGALRRLGGRYLIVFGQGFQGAYDPFEGIVAQQYTEAVRYFRLDPYTRQAMGMGEITSADADQPFHRRDGPFVDTLDPATGAARVTAYGGVFAPGMLEGYFNPVYIDERFNQLVATTDRSVQQLCNQYDCPVVVVWDSAQQTLYSTFFGGISRSFYYQTPEQQAVYQAVTQEGRNDGFPFVADISVLIQGPNSEGGQQWIAPAPIPGNLLQGTSVDFIPLPGPAVSSTGVIDLSALSPGSSTPIGYIFGGIDADFPLPKIPNYGSQATNAIYQVVLNYQSTPGYIPAGDATLADGIWPPSSAA